MELTVVLQHINKVAFTEVMPGHKPADIIKLETKRHILTDESGITPSANITSVNTHEVTVTTDTVDSILIK